jgi:tetratricopeptide (TPR) repeat protein
MGGLHWYEYAHSRQLWWVTAMFRTICLLALAIIAASSVPALSQDNSPEQQACFDRRADQPTDLDYRIGACLRVIGDSVLGASIRAEAYLRRALAHAQKAAQSNSKEDVDRAVADLSEGLRLDPDNAAAQRYVYQTRAGLYFHSADYDRALADYTALIRLEPNSATAYHYRGIVHATKGDHEPAIADFTQAIRLEPKAVHAYNQRAWSYLQAGKPGEALADADQAVALGPNDAESYSTRVVVYRALGKTSEVVADLRTALSLDPSNDGIKEELRSAEQGPSSTDTQEAGKAAARFFNQRAWSHMQAGNGAAALSAADRALALDPNNAASYSTRALVFRTLGKASESIADLRKALALDPSNKGIKEELEKAEQTVRVAVAKQPDADVAKAERREKELLEQVQKAQEAARAAEQERQAALKAAEDARRAASAAEKQLADLKAQERTKATEAVPSPQGPTTAPNPVKAAEPAGSTAKEPAAAPPDVKTASVAATPEPTRPSEVEQKGPDPAKLARDLQGELKRVGCDPGPLDGKWGKRARSALQKFASQTKLTVSLDEPTTAALEAVATKKGRVCPLDCDDDEVEVNGKCVDKPAKGKRG